MATDRTQERLYGMMFPTAMKHVQQLIMDAEACAKNHGKKSIFGTDKFQSSFDKFNRTLAHCVVALTTDGVIINPQDSQHAIEKVDYAMRCMEDTYSNWPQSFQFWKAFYANHKS